ncbi:MAG: hypothetical protein OXI46_11245 [Gemmatimonadota bacterium]|nr:hypothetical protein [Gemmatimonadota bacterium]
MLRVLTALAWAALGMGTAAADSPEALADGPLAAAPGFPELAVMLEERASSLDAILAIQSELLALAARDPRAAMLARPAMSRCHLALPELWCSRLDSTFRPESGP